MDGQMDQQTNDPARGQTMSKWMDLLTLFGCKDSYLGMCANPVQVDCESLEKHTQVIKGLCS